MKAVQVLDHGGPETMRLVDLPEPEPGPGQVVIRVESAAVNWSDLVRRGGGLYPFPTPMPFVPGGEVAGRVEAVGVGVAHVAAGDEVFALVGGDGSGGYAELAVAEAASTIPRPPSVSADEAAALIIAGGTAMLLLREAARLEKGESVLVEAAGGGVGSYAVQLAKLLGAGPVIGAAGTAARRAAAVEAGADHVLDYTEGGWGRRVRDLTDGRGVDVALETVGRPTLGEAFDSLAAFGRMVVYGMASGEAGALSAQQQEALFYRPALNQTVTGFNLGVYFGVRPEAAVAALTEVVGLAAAGSLTVPVGQRMPLADAARAHELLARREVVGKIILKP